MGSQSLRHGHSAPSIWAAIERYTNELTDKIEQVVLAALDRSQAGAPRVGKEAKSVSRRTAENFPTKLIDHDLPVLVVTGLDGKVRAIFTSYACHCTTIAFNVFHSDWAGGAQQALERDFPGAIAFTAIGCGADQNPAPRGTLELATQHGEELAAEAKRVAGGKLTPITGALTCRTKQINLACDTLPTREQWEALAASPTAGIAYHARKNLERLDRGETLPTELPYLVQAWTFGDDLAMVFLPGEVVVDYSVRLKGEFDKTRLWVNAYSNDAPCYIPSKRILDEGGYEGGSAMVYYDRPTRFAPDVEERIISAVHDIMPKSYAGAAEDQPLFVATPLTAEGSFTDGVEGPACDAAGNIYAVNFAREQTIGKVTPGRGRRKSSSRCRSESDGNGIRFTQGWRDVHRRLHRAQRVARGYENEGGRHFRSRGLLDVSTRTISQLAPDWVVLPERSGLGVGRSRTCLARRCARKSDQGRGENGHAQWHRGQPGWPHALRERKHLALSVGFHHPGRRLAHEKTAAREISRL